MLPEEIKSNYKPYRVTKKRGVTIIDSTSGSFVVKEKTDEKVREAYQLFSKTTRSFSK